MVVRPEGIEERHVVRRAEPLLVGLDESLVVGQVRGQSIDERHLVRHAKGSVVVRPVHLVVTRRIRDHLAGVPLDPIPHGLAADVRGDHARSQGQCLVQIFLTPVADCPVGPIPVATGIAEVHGGLEARRQIDVEIRACGHPLETQIVEGSRRVEERAAEEVAHPVGAAGDGQGVLRIDGVAPHLLDPVPVMRRVVVQLVLRVVACVGGGDVAVA